MKLQTEIMAICDYATVSQDNKLSVIGIFDELRAKTLPTALGRGFLVATLRGKPESFYTLTLTVESGSEKSLAKPIQLNIRTSFNGKFNLLLELANFTFKHQGAYRFVLYQAKKEIGMTNLDVLQLHEPKHKEAKVIN